MNNRKKQIRSSCILLAGSIIWGIAFVAQSEGGDAVGPYTFNCVRCLIGGVVLLPVIVLMDRLGYTPRRPKNSREKKRLLAGGAICGVALFLASTVQQLGITYGSSVGKAGFVTACYILLVPIFGMFLGKKCGWNVWISVFLTLIGLSMLCLREGIGSIQYSDILLLMCAFFFSVQILAVDHFSPMVDGVRLACIEFFVCGGIGLIPMCLLEMGHSAAGLWEWSLAFTSWSAWLPILYAGVLSCGVAYTCQIFGQEGLNPTVASLLMSMESVFSVLAGALILGQFLSARELAGCVLIFAAIVLAQIPFPERKAKDRSIHPL